MNKVIILLFLLASCATTNRFGQPKRELAAQLPDFFTSCLSNLHQLFQPPKLVIKNDEIYWHLASILLLQDCTPKSMITQSTLI